MSMQFHAINKVSLLRLLSLPGMMGMAPTSHNGSRAFLADKRGLRLQ